MNVAVFDIDGVLADNEDHSKWFDSTGIFIKEEFLKSVPTMKPISWGVSLLNALLKEDYKIVLVTARDADSANETTKWLGEHNITFHEIYFNPSTDGHKSPISHKLQSVGNYSQEEIKFIFEDNPAIVKAYREAGYTCLQPNHNYPE